MSMKLSVADGHLCNMGRMIEEMESKLRNSLDQVFLDYMIQLYIFFFSRSASYFLYLFFYLFSGLGRAD